MRIEHAHACETENMERGRIPSFGSGNTTDSDHHTIQNDFKVNFQSKIGRVNWARESGARIGRANRARESGARIGRANRAHESGARSRACESKALRACESGTRTLVKLNRP